MHDGQVCARGERVGGLYQLVRKHIQTTVQAVLTNRHCHAENCMHLLHRRLGHPSYPMLEKTLACTKRMTVNKCACFLDCSVCKSEKCRAVPVAKQSTQITSAPFQLCAVDLISPLPPSHGGARYDLLIVDHFSRFLYCYPLKSKDKMFRALTNWVKMVEWQFQPVKVAAIQTDRGGEFCSARLEAWLTNRGIRHCLMDAANPSQNGLVERQCQKLQTVARCLLWDSGLSWKYWAEVFNTACYTINRLWQSPIAMTPYPKNYGEMPAINHMKTLGSPAWLFVPSKQR